MSHPFYSKSLAMDKALEPLKAIAREYPKMNQTQAVPAPITFTQEDKTVAQIAIQVAQELELKSSQPDLKRVGHYTLLLRKISNL